MGYLAVVDMLDHADFNTALVWHLQSNHYPPVHSDFIPAVKKAIKRANAGDYERIITLPNGRKLSVGSIIEQLHLEPFLNHH